MLELKVKYFDQELPEISFLEQGDWIDLRSAENFDYKAGDFFLIPLGVAMELPPGYEAHLVPRSSTFKNFGIIQTNGTGIIDESYSGNNDQWFMPALAFRKGIINKGDRICQFRILEKMAKVKFTTVEHLANKNRGGHGSTGTN